MYFDASERIAHKTSYPRSQIEKIDNFLAGQDIKRFELRQLQEKTEIYTDVSPILEVYIRERVLSKETVYLCPEHLVTLEPANRNEGRCIDCDRVYPFEDCSIKLVYERVRQPNVKKVSISQHPAETKEKEVPWFKQPGNVLAIIGLVITFFGTIFACVAIIPILFPANTQQADDLIKTPTLIVTVEATLEQIVEITVTVEETSLPVATAETTPELAGIP